MRAAKLLGIPPWDAEDAPEYWVSRVLAYEEAEGKAEEELAKRAARQNEKKRTR